jgi:hypothetical protein
MAFNPVSYFAGIGTVAVAIAVGFGGGLLMTNSIHKPEAPNRLERVASSAPLASPAAPPASASPIQASIAPDVTLAPVPEPGPSASPQQVAPSQPQQPPPVATTQATNQQPAVATDPPPLSAREAAKSQDQDSDARKQDSDARRVAERRQMERRKWAERKRRQQELDAATVEVRRNDRDDGSREIVQRDLIEMPRSGFFGQ